MEHIGPMIVKQLGNQNSRLMDEMINSLEENSKGLLDLIRKCMEMIKDNIECVRTIPEIISK
jgi:hypothetical protein